MPQFDDTLLLSLCGPAISSIEALVQLSNLHLDLVTVKTKDKSKKDEVDHGTFLTYPRRENGDSWGKRSS